MTNPFDGYDDIFGDEQPFEIAPTLRRLSVFGQTARRHGLSKSKDREILAALRQSSPNDHIVSFPTQDSRHKVPRKRTAGTAASAAMASRRSRLLWRSAGLAAALVIMAASASLYALTQTRPTTVSAAAVLRRAAAFSLQPGQIARFTYRTTLKNGVDTRCLEGSTAAYWVRGRQGTLPQVVVEKSLYEPCFSKVRCPVVVVQEQVYRFSQLCPGLPAGAAPGVGVRMIPRKFSNSGMATNLIYRTSAIRHLEAASSQKGTVVAHRAMLGGHDVYVVTLKLSDDPHEKFVTLYFDAKSYLLRGMDFPFFDYPTPSPQSGRLAFVTKVRLIHMNLYASQTPWQRVLSKLPRYTPWVNSLVGPEKQSGADLIGFPGWPTLADAKTSCPGLPQVSPQLLAAESPLELCRTAEPDISVSKLVWRLMRHNISLLNTAVRAHILPRRQVRVSVRAEHRWISKWVTKKGALR